MTVFQPLATRLARELEPLSQRVSDLLSKATISKRFDNDDSHFVVITPYPWGWAGVTVEARPQQVSLLHDYGIWERTFSVVAPRLPSDLGRQAEECCAYLRACIEQDPDEPQLVPKTVAKAKSRASERAEDLIRVLESLAQVPPHGIVLVPDTNAMTLCPDPVEYRDVLGVEDFTFLLTPVLLRELDSLKPRAKGDFREKVRSAIKRIKGWGAQGDLSIGIRVNGSIIVRSVATEPKFDTLPGHFDRGNQDDRLMGTLLEEQRAAPGACVVVATGDMNLQNKARFHRVPFVEAPGDD